MDAWDQYLSLYKSIQAQISCYARKVFPGWQEKLTKGAVLMPLVLFPVVFALFFSSDL